MYCEKCGAPLKDGAVYCHSCGTSATTPSSTEVGKGFADTLEKASLGAAKGIASAPMVVVGLLIFSISLWMVLYAKRLQSATTDGQPKGEDMQS